MRVGSRHPAFIAGLMAFLLLMAACGDDDGTPFVPPQPDTTPPAVSATPSGGAQASFPAGVTLNAVDNRDPAPVIYYTTDASIPTDQSTMFDGTPIPIGDNTILKFFAVDASGNASDVVTEGYVVTGGSAITEAWAQSGHGDITAEAWRHWDEDGAVPTSCAKCHSPVGFVDYAEDGMVDLDAPLPLGLSCDGCHQGGLTTLWEDLATYPAMDPIVFPSGEAVSLFGNSNMCMACHQGRASSDDVDDAISQNPGGPHNFINIHYYAAAATNFGSEVRGGYQYAGMDYLPRNTFPSHPQSLSTCVGCHMRGANDDHTFVPQLGDCTGCHGGSSFETLGGTPSLNHTNIQALEGELLDEIQDYASTTVGTAICYDSAAYPYWFIDTNGNGVCDGGEANYGNRYTAFDDALLQAAYNYQVSAKDPCGYIHNGAYMLQLLYDSIMDLGGSPSYAPPGRTGFTTSGLTATQAATAQFKVAGHAAAAGEPFRHWDDTGEVEASCVQCHSSSGYVDYIDNETIDDGPVLAIEVVECRACHVSNNLYADATTYYDAAGPGDPLTDVLFPSGATQSLGDNSNLCMVCHQGRASGLDIASATANSVVQTPDYASFDFINRHYYAAAAILFGADVNAGFEFGVSYAGENTFGAHGGINKQTCVECHMRNQADHSWEIPLADCSGCHSGITNFDELGNPFGAPNTDYDGDGTGEGYQEEIDGMAAVLLAEIYDYAINRLNGGANSSAIVYSPTAYPYWFRDLDSDGIADPDETNFGNRYRDFDGLLLAAAYNYHSAQDPCGGIHNYTYVLQTVYDSIDVMDDGSLPLNNSPAVTFGMTRP